MELVRIAVTDFLNWNSSRSNISQFQSPFLCHAAFLVATCRCTSVMHLAITFFWSYLPNCVSLILAFSLVNYRKLLWSFVFILCTSKTPNSSWDKWYWKNKTSLWLSQGYTGWFKAPAQNIRWYLGRSFGAENVDNFFFHIRHRFLVLTSLL